MSRSSILQYFQKKVSQEMAATQARKTTAPSPAAQVTRRAFLTNLSAAAGTAALYNVPLLARPSGASPSIAIVGAGLSGLSAAMALKDAGHRAAIYEFSTNRVGGRTQTDLGSAQDMVSGGACGVCHDSRRNGDAGSWDDGQYTDIFGEMIDSGHTTMRSLAGRFGLPLIDSLAAEPPGSTETYFFSGGYYSKSQADADFALLWPKLRKDLTDSGYPTLYNKSRPGGVALDNISIYDWIETRIPGGHAHPLGKMLDIAYVIEYGADSYDQSALSLIYLLAYGSKNTFSAFGESDERFRVKGGTWQICKAMADFVGWDASIKFGHRLTAISKAADGRTVLSFDVAGSAPRSVTADIVLLTVPFAVLKDLDYSNAGFDALKHKAIQELGAGRNGKLHLQFSSRYWNSTGPWGRGNGSAYSDTGFQNTWEPTRGLAGQSGILVKYTGGSATTALNQNHPYGNQTNSRTMADAATFVSQLESVFPGIGPLWNGKAAGAMPHVDPRFRCSYSYWRVGQYTTIAGYEGVPQGNIFFAGEHTSPDYQGWMEGAVRSGISAANAIIASI